MSSTMPSEMSGMMTLYRALLHLYPSSFRQEYGEEMCALLARRMRDTGPPAAPAPPAPLARLSRLALWAAAAAEILPNAAAVHWDLLRQDLRYLARTLRREPGFAFTAVAVIALGIGATTAAFSVTDFVLIRPLPFPRPERLVKVWESSPDYPRMEPSPANYRDWQRLTHSFASIGALHQISVNLVGQGEPQRLEGAAVTADLLPLLGVRPALGRLFTAADDRDGAPGTVVLSHRLWQSELGGDPKVLGRRLLLDGEPFVVVGVMPRDFYFPRREQILWVPMRFRPSDFDERDNTYLEVVARLAPGVSLAQARAEMRVAAAALERQYPKENEQVSAVVLLLRDELSSQARLLLVALCGASLCVLLIACANLANLLLARALARRQELDVRSALGAGRERLVRQLATESLTLAFAGGALGVLVAIAALPLLARLVPVNLPLAQAPAIDPRVLAFAGLLTALTGIGFGTLPALRACRDADLGGLRQGVRAGGGRRERLRSMLVVAEVAAAVVLLVSAGLLMRALARIQATDPGFRPNGVLTVRTALPIPKYDSVARRAAFYDRVLTEVRALPGVTAAGFITYVPMVWRGGIWPIAIDNQPHVRTGSTSASLRFVTPGLFAALGIPLLQGRDVRDTDAADRQFVAVVSRSFVRRFWPDGNPLGRHFQVAFHDRTVVGVVGDVRVRGFERTSEPQVYLPNRQVQDGWLVFFIPRDLVIRSAAEPTALLPAIRRIVHAVDPEQPVSDVQTLAQVVAGETASRAVQVRVLAAFAAIAFLLAGIGIYGLLSFAVSQRAHEIGVRMALGAGTDDILAMVLRRAALLAAAGVLPGALLAYAAGRAMAALLAGLNPGDAPTFLAAMALCLLMTSAGSLWPALRAVRVDPITVIRKE